MVCMLNVYVKPRFRQDFKTRFSPLQGKENQKNVVSVQNWLEQ